jgi:hypothetical protein
VRLDDAVVLRLENLRSMTPQAFRAAVALMLGRFGPTTTVQVRPSSSFDA